jgi:hypothetical protein
MMPDKSAAMPLDVISAPSLPIPLRVVKIRAEAPRKRREFVMSDSEPVDFVKKFRRI